MSSEMHAANRVRNKGLLFLAAVGAAAGAVTSFYDPSGGHPAHHVFAGTVLLVLAGFMGAGFGSVLGGYFIVRKGKTPGMDASDEIAMFAASLGAVPGLLAVVFSSYSQYAVHGAAAGAFLGGMISSLPLGGMSIAHDILLLTEQSDAERSKGRGPSDRNPVLDDPAVFPKQVVMERTLQDAKEKAKK